MKRRLAERARMYFHFGKIDDLKGEGIIYAFGYFKTKCMNGYIYVCIGVKRGLLCRQSF